MNTAFPDDMRWSRAITNASPMFVPRVGDRVFVGYNPAPTVKNVIWDYDKSDVLVQIE